MSRVPSVETILNTGFSTGGQAWDRTPLRKATMLFLLTAMALLIAVSGLFITFDDLAADYPSGYVVSNSENCRLVISERPGGPPVETVEQNSGGRMGTCGGLDKGMKVYYDPGRGIQAFSDDEIKAGFIVIPAFALLAGVPGLLAWIHTLQKRRARTRAAVASS